MTWSQFGLKINLMWWGIMVLLFPLIFWAEILELTGTDMKGEEGG